MEARSLLCTCGITGHTDVIAAPLTCVSHHTKCKVHILDYEQKVNVLLRQGCPLTKASSSASLSGWEASCWSLPCCARKTGALLSCARLMMWSCSPRFVRITACDVFLAVALISKIVWKRRRWFNSQTWVCGVWRKEWVNTNEWRVVRGASIMPHKNMHVHRVRCAQMLSQTKTTDHRSLKTSPSPPPPPK